MASYLELRSLFSDSELRNRMEVAVAIAATRIAQNSTVETVSRVAWAKQALGNTGPEADKALIVALASNSTLTTLQLQGASDQALQSAVDTAVKVLV